MADQTYSDKFNYSHNNPYHDRLSNFDDFVLRDHEAEEKKGNWNSEVFKREAPLFLEIGSGYGHFMMKYCEQNPDVNFIGLDYRFKRSFELAKKLNNHPTRNFRYLRAKGERIEFLFSQKELDGIFYFFPDPWPKTRHKKKRLFSETFLESASKVLKSGGKIFIKTDHDDYAQAMAKVIEETKLPFKLTFSTTDLRGEHPEHFLSSFVTKFEKIFLAQEINIKAFVLEKL